VNSADVHKEAIVIAVQNESGKLVMESVIETKASSSSAVSPRSTGQAACDLGRRTWAAKWQQPAAADDYT